MLSEFNKLNSWNHLKEERNARTNDDDHLSTVKIKYSITTDESNHLNMFTNGLLSLSNDIELLF